jgi:hypothetical protein
VNVGSGEAVTWPGTDVDAPSSDLTEAIEERVDALPTPLI